MSFLPIAVTVIASAATADERMKRARLESKMVLRMCVFMNVPLRFLEFLGDLMQRGRGAVDYLAYHALRCLSLASTGPQSLLAPATVCVAEAPPCRERLLTARLLPSTLRVQEQVLAREPIPLAFIQPVNYGWYIDSNGAYNGFVRTP